MSKSTALIFFGIILLGLIASLIYFATKDDGSGGAIQPLVSNTDVKPAPAGPEAKPEDPKPSDPAKPAESPTTPKATPGDAPAKPKTTEAAAKPEFGSPAAAMKALAEKAGSKNFPEFLGFVGEEAIEEKIRPGVKELIESPVYFLSEEKPFSEVSKSAGGVRWSLNYVPKNDAASKQLYADLVETESDTFRFSRISLPLELTSVISKPTDPAAPDAKPAPAVEGIDALTIAHAFSKAVIGRDFKVARALSDPTTVTDERVAALMFAIEEGGFQLRDERPLVVTLSRDDITWVLTRVQSKESGSEFALELGKVGENWSVNGLTFSKVLSALAEQAGGGGIAYSPIVEDPMGGDSLVLYFEFDDSAVTPRGSRQLAVIADILSQGADRVIRINGHADAMGTDEYNAGLSNRRAEAIRSALISMGVTPSQIVTEGFGESKPRRPNFNPDGTDNAAGRSQNRRAEVYLDF